MKCCAPDEAQTLPWRINHLPSAVLPTKGPCLPLLQGPQPPALREITSKWMRMTNLISPSVSYKSFSHFVQKPRPLSLPSPPQHKK